MVAHAQLGITTLWFQLVPKPQPRCWYWIFLLSRVAVTVLLFNSKDNCSQFGSEVQLYTQLQSPRSKFNTCGSEQQMNHQKHLADGDYPFPGGWRGRCQPRHVHMHVPFVFDFWLVWRAKGCVVCFIKCTQLTKKTSVSNVCKWIKQSLRVAWHSDGLRFD